MLPVCNLSEDRPWLQAADFIDSSSQIFSDSKAELLHGTSLYLYAYLYCHNVDMSKVFVINESYLLKAYHAYLKRKIILMCKQSIIRTK